MNENQHWAYIKASNKHEIVCPVVNVHTVKHYKVQASGLAIAYYFVIDQTDRLYVLC
jgi:hypothetical protein